MRFKVYLLRERGRRISWPDAQNGRTYVGARITHLEEHGGERCTVLQIHPSDPMSSDRPPALYEPVLVAFAPVAFRLRGFERIDGQAGWYRVVRGWHCEQA